MLNTELKGAKMVSTDYILVNGKILIIDNDNVKSLSSLIFCI